MSVSHARSLRFVIATILVGFASALLVVAVPRVAHAAPEITGKVWDPYSEVRVPGQTVRLWSNAGGSPGTLLDTDVTDGLGNFELEPPTPDVRYFIQLVGTDYRRGWLATNGYFEPLGDATRTVAPGADLGRVNAIPMFVQGTVVNQATENPVSGVVVTAVEPGTHESLGRDTTNDRGRFRIEDVILQDDSIEIRFNGSAVGYESGWGSCFHTVVPTSGEGCAVSLGRIGSWRIQVA